MLNLFFMPYVNLCLQAAWGVAQNLEGLGFFGYLNTAPMIENSMVFYPTNFNPAQGVGIIAAIISCVFFIVFLLNIRACFYLNKWFGVISLVLWFLPGILSVVGWMPEYQNMGPDVFRFGKGFPGSTVSGAANLFICLLGGWSIIMLFSTLWKKNSFKNAYDHVWYTVGLSAALYFVVDTGLPSYKDDLSNADNHMVQTLQFFYSAEERIQTLCLQPEVIELSSSLCKIAPELKSTTLDYLELNKILRAKIEPPDWTVRLPQSQVLADQINVLNNWACVQGQALSQCQKIPIGTAISMKDLDTLVVFPPPSYAEKIQSLHESMKKTDLYVQDIEKAHNLRYFLFLLLAFLAGGKLANSSRAMIKHDITFLEKSWLVIIFKYAYVFMVGFLSRCKLLFNYLKVKIFDMFFYLIHKIKKLLKHYKNSRKFKRKQSSE